MADYDRLKKDLISDEGLKLKPYRCTENKLTIGVGRNIEDTGITEAEAYFMLDNDVRRVDVALQKDPDVGHIFMLQSDARQEALINMAFQMGVVGVKGFRKMWAALSMRDYERAYREAIDSQWARQTPNRAKRVAEQLRDGDV